MSDNNPLEWCDKHKILDECGEPVASPQATKPDAEMQTRILDAAYAQQKRMESAAQPAAGTTPQGMVTAFGTFNSGFLQHVSWARHHLADSPEVEIKRMRFYPAPDPPEPSKGTTPQAERCALKARFVTTEQMLLIALEDCVKEHNAVCAETCKCPHDAIQTAKFLIETDVASKIRAVAPVETPDK